MASDLVIRRATVEDAPALASLLTELGYPWPAETIASRVAALEGAGSVALIALKDGKALGTTTLHATPTIHRPTAVGRITAMVVTEAARGLGVGRALVAEAERVLAERGCALMEVTSNMRRGDAHAFYEHLGYDRTSYRFAKAIRPGSTG